MSETLRERVEKLRDKWVSQKGWADGDYWVLAAGELTDVLTEVGAKSGPPDEKPLVQTKVYCGTHGEETAPAHQPSLCECGHSIFECHDETGCHWRQQGAVRGCPCRKPQPSRGDAPDNFLGGGKNVSD